MTVISDEKLVADYLKGDEKSLESLIERYLKPIYGFAYKYVRNAKDAEDITQETFVKAWRHLKGFDPSRCRFATLRGKPNKSFRIWLFQIAKNSAIDFIRKSRSAEGGKKVLPFSDFDTENGNIISDTIVDQSPLPQEILENKEIGQILASTTEKLPAKYREVLSLRYNEQLKFKEIAEFLGESLNTVKSRHRRGLALLKKLLA